MLRELYFKASQNDSTSCMGRDTQAHLPRRAGDKEAEVLGQRRLERSLVFERSPTWQNPVEQTLK